MSSAILTRVQLDSNARLVERLIREHRGFPPLIHAMVDGLGVRGSKELSEEFTRLWDILTEHMLIEESDVYSELARLGLFDAETSEIMQQHHDVTTCLGKMELALRIRNLHEFGATLDELDRVLRVHQPAEEEKVFPKIPPM